MPPLQQPPSGPLPTGDRGPTLNAIQVVMIISASSAVLLRFVARRMSAAGLWWDDWMILAALIPSIGINITNITATTLGLGKHIWDVEDGGHMYLRSVFALEVIYTTALALNKLSILLMYQRLFSVERRLTLAIKVVAGIVIAWWIGIEVATFLQCQPIEKFWEYPLPGTCFDVVKFFEGSAVPNVITDAVILLLPQPILWKLHMSRSNKLALCGIFLLGAFTAVSSIGRLITIIHYHEGPDFTWDAFTAIVWYSLEPAVGIVCACLPCMGPLVRRLSGSSLGSHQNKSRTGSCTDLSRPANTPGPRGRKLSLDTASMARLAPRESSCKTSVYASASQGLDDVGEEAGENRSHELNAVHVRNNGYITSPMSPQGRTVYGTEP